MRTIKKGLSVFLVCVMILCSAPLVGFVGIELPEIDFGKIFDVKAGAAEVVESGSWGKNVTYTLDSDGLLTISGTGNMLLDHEYAPWYPNRTTIKEVVIENGVTNISDYAFLGCTELVSITIPSSVKMIGWFAFDSCTSLSAVSLTDIEAWCNIYFHYDFENPLYYASNLYLNGELVTELLIPETVTKIQPYAFNGCTSLTSVTIPSSVTSIETGAFGGCSSLEDIVIENKVCQIANSVDTIPETTTIHGYAGSSANAYAKINNRSFVFLDGTAGEIIDAGSCGENMIWFLDDEGLLTVSGTGKMKDFYTFSESYLAPWDIYKNEIKSVILADGITSIGSNAFNGCSNLKTIIIPDGITSIGNYAFDDCSSLQTITLPDNITSIGNGAFSYCKSLQTITIPDSVTSIGSSAFFACSELQGAIIPNGVSSIESLTFSGCSNLQTVTLSENILSIGASAFSRCESLQNIIIPKSVESIGDNAFSFCDNLTTIVLGDNIKKIGKSAFFSCDNIQQIVFPDSVRNIEGMAFSCCSNLATVVFGENVKTIAESAFGACTKLQIVGYVNDADSRNGILISDGNEKLLNATWYYNCCKESHQYSGDCDASCDVCDFPRSVAGSHTYTNTCDDSCDICGEIRYVYHTYTDECDSVCNICNYEREIIYDYTITTDDEITLTYSSDRDVEFVISDTSVSYVRSTGKSSIVVGSYASIKTSATITPKKPGSVIVSVVDGNNNVLTKALLLIMEGEHQLVLSEIVSEQSCVNPKEYIYKCKYCSYEERVYEDPLGHSYVGTITTNPTCTTAGVKTFVCSNDASHTYTETVAALGHTPGADATCTTDQTCTVCGEVLTEKLGHDYKSVVTAPTCEKDGYTTYTCAICGDSYDADEVAALGHSWDEGVITVEPTVETEGVMTCTCSVCGATKTEVIEKLQPAFTESEDAILTDDGNICANIGKTAESLLAQASDGATLVDKNGNALSADSKVGTGAVLTLADGTEYVIIVPGDTDGDAAITSADARFALRYSVGLETLPADSVFVLAADVDTAGVTASDARSILRSAVGLDNPDAWFEKIYNNIQAQKGL